MLVCQIGEWVEMLHMYYKYIKKALCPEASVLKWKMSDSLVMYLKPAKYFFD